MSSKCNLCPRNCGIDRRIQKGYCKAPHAITAARSSLHFWEEPCISGVEGSGTVFFSGCSMGCVYCQNFDIAHQNFGKEISIERLCDIFLELQNKKANNINLVTPTHYADKIIEAVKLAKQKGLKIPVVYNTSGYEKEETIESLKDTVDIFMPDFKYWLSETAKKYSNAPDYPEIAKKAIDKMVTLNPHLVFDKRAMLQKGVIIRILLLPGFVYEAKRITEYVYSKYGDSVIISLMSQYTPNKNTDKFPEINRKVRKKEYENLVDYVINLGAKNVYIQEGSSADESFIPPFNLEGI
ncbi:MAG: radical SAM protein [Clostridia bacterium]|nr:radical SAM protein [Clostridia bacterium]